MKDFIILNYKNNSYIIFKNSIESYDQFYKRAWLISKKSPKTEIEFKKINLEVQKIINNHYLGYEY